MQKIWSVENSLVLFAKWPHTTLLIQVLWEWNWHILHFQDFNDAQSFHFLLRSDNGKHGLLMYDIKSNKEASCSFPDEPCNSSLHRGFLRKKKWSNCTVPGWVQYTWLFLLSTYIKYTEKKNCRVDRHKPAK